MRGIVNNDAQQQHERQCAGRFPDHNQTQCAQRQPGQSPAPDRRQRNRAGGNRPFRAVLAVEIRIKRVVQKHPTEIKRGDAEE